MGLLSALAGVRGEATQSAPSSAPPPEEAHFVAALLEAFGLGAERVQAADPADPDISDTVRGLAMILSTAGDADGSATGDSEAGQSLRTDAEPRVFVDLGTVGIVPTEGRATTTASSGQGADGLAGASADGAASTGSSLAESGAGDALGRGARTDGAASIDAELESVRTQDLASVAAVDASAAAADAQEVQEALGPDDVDASLDRVHPALRDSVETVMERMRDEFGYHVTVVEGYRSSRRQAHLYAQGRTQPGQITTWTRRSWHTDGLAADLQIDGGYDDRLAYMRLQRIAREEGLRTLGSRDLGHVEMPGTRVTDGAGLDAPAGPTRRFVGVAVPAPVAAPAAPAAVAMPGSWITIDPATPSATTPPPAPLPVEAPVLGADATGMRATFDELDARQAQRVAAGRTGATADGGSSSEDSLSGGAGKRREAATEVESRAAKADGAHRAVEQATLKTDLAGVQGARGGVTVDGVSPTERAGALDGPTSLQRAERIQEIQDLARAAQPSRISLRLGENEQLRVGVLNQLVDAELDLADPARASEIRNRVADLHRALESRGMELGALSVNGATGAQAAANGWLGGSGDAAADLLRTLFASSGDSAQSGPGRDRPTPEHGTRQDGGGSRRTSRDAREEGDK